MFLPKEYREYLGLGAEIALSLSAPIFFGVWLDKTYDTAPAFLLAGVGLGLILFFMLIFRITKKLNKPKK